MRRPAVISFDQIGTPFKEPKPARRSAVIDSELLRDPLEAHQEISQDLHERRELVEEARRKAELDVDHMRNDESVKHVNEDSICNGCVFAFRHSGVGGFRADRAELNIYCAAPWLRNPQEKFGVLACNGFVRGEFMAGAVARMQAEDEIIKALNLDEGWREIIKAYKGPIYTGPQGGKYKDPDHKVPLTKADLEGGGAKQAAQEEQAGNRQPGQQEQGGNRQPGAAQEQDGKKPGAAPEQSSNSKQAGAEQGGGQPGAKSEAGQSTQGGAEQQAGSQQAGGAETPTAAQAQEEIKGLAAKAKGAWRSAVEWGKDENAGTVKVILDEARRGHLQMLREVGRLAVTPLAAPGALSKFFSDKSGVEATGLRKKMEDFTSYLDKKTNATKEERATGLAYLACYGSLAVMPAPQAWAAGKAMTAAFGAGAKTVLGKIATSAISMGVLGPKLWKYGTRHLGRVLAEKITGKKLDRNEWELGEGYINGAQFKERVKEDAKSKGVTMSDEDAQKRLDDALSRRVVKAMEVEEAASKLTDEQIEQMLAEAMLEVAPEAMKDALDEQAKEGIDQERYNQIAASVKEIMAGYSEEQLQNEDVVMEITAKALEPFAGEEMEREEKEVAERNNQPDEEQAPSGDKDKDKEA